MCRYASLLLCGLVFLSPRHAGGEDAAEARAIVDKAIEAAGGRESLAKYEKPFVMEFKVKTVTAGGGSHESTAKKTRWLPDRFRDESPMTQLHGKVKGSFTTLFNGQSGKVTGFDTRKGVTVFELNATQIEKAQDQIYGEWLTTLLPLDGADFHLAAAREIILDQRPSVGVKVSHESRPDVELYFDKETFVLTKFSRPIRRPDGNGRLSQLYDDYVEADGLVYPRKCVEYIDDVKRRETEITEFTFLDELDETVFEHP